MREKISWVDNSALFHTSKEHNVLCIGSALFHTSKEHNVLCIGSALSDPVESFLTMLLTRPLWRKAKYLKAVFRIRIQFNLDPDPAKNLNLDPDPSYFLTLSENNIKLFHIIRFSQQNKSIVVKHKIILWLFNIFDLFLSPWIQIRIRNTALRSTACKEWFIAYHLTDAPRAGLLYSRVYLLPYTVYEHYCN